VFQSYITSVMSSLWTSVYFLEGVDSARMSLHSSRSVQVKIRGLDVYDHVSIVACEFANSVPAAMELLDSEQARD